MLWNIPLLRYPKKEPSAGCTIFFRDDAVSSPKARLMVAPFEIVLKDSAVQENWFRRLVAAIIDWILLGIVIAILSVILFAGWILTTGADGWGVDFSPGVWMGLGVVSFSLTVLGIVYFAVTESMWGASIGKMLLGLKVAGEDGRNPLIVNAFIRNVSRIHGLIFLLDFIGGMILEGDPRQRFTDRFAKTVVYQAKSRRGGPFIEPRILGPDEASAASGGVAPPPAPPAPGTEKPAEGAKPEEGPPKCPKCQTPIKPGDAFCRKCGQKLT